MIKVHNVDTWLEGHAILCLTDILESIAAAMAQWVRVVMLEVSCNVRGQCVPKAENNQKPMLEWNNPTPLSLVRVVGVKGM